jgi:hypothetical protein
MQKASDQPKNPAYKNALARMLKFLIFDLIIYPLFKIIAKYLQNIEYFAST